MYMLYTIDTCAFTYDTPLIVFDSCAFHISKVPSKWSSLWEGPEDPPIYLRSLVARALALGVWEEKSQNGTLLKEGMLDLSELFHPDTFLNALRQLTARWVGVYVGGGVHWGFVCAICMRACVYSTCIYMYTSSFNIPRNTLRNGKCKGQE